MPPRSYRFGRFRLDPSTRELCKDDARVALAPKSFDCLAYLIEQRSRAVGRDELISAVWGRVDVNDALLGQTLARARRAIGDTGGEQSVIRTVPRFGYRWVAPVEVVESTAAIDAGAAPLTASAAAARAPEPAAAPITPSRPRSQEKEKKRGFARFVGATIALLTIALAGAWVLRHPGAPAPPAAAPVPAREVYLVLPVSVAGGEARDAWIRLGAMDYAASRLRQDAHLQVLPSDEVVGLVGKSDRLDADDLQRIAGSAAASRILAPQATRTGDGWRVRLEVREHGELRSFEHEAAAPLQAMDLALGDYLASIGAGHTPAAPPDALTELQQQVDAAFLDGDPRRARELIDHAPQVLRETPSLLVRGGEIDARAGRLDAAEQQFRRVLDATESASAPLRARAEYGFCTTAFRRNDFDAAVQRCSAAAATLGEQRDPVLSGRIHMLRGVAYGANGAGDQALADIARARMDWELAGDRRGGASLDVNEGLILRDLGRYAEALTAFDKAIGILAQLGVNDSLASALTAKADTQLITLDLAGAEDASARAWALLPQLQNPNGVRRVAFSHARVLVSIGQLGAADAILERYTDAAATLPEFAVLHAQLQLERGAAAAALQDADAVFDRVEHPADRGSEASVADAAAVYIDAALRAGQRSRAEHFLARLVAAGDSRIDTERPFFRELGRAGIAALADPPAADTHFAAALALAGRSGRADEVVTAASAYARYLIGQRRLDEATGVIGHLAPYVSQDYHAARSAAAFYAALGDPSRQTAAEGEVRRLAGERESSPRP